MKKDAFMIYLTKKSLHVSDRWLLVYFLEAVFFYYAIFRLHHYMFMFASSPIEKVFALITRF